MAFSMYNNLVLSIFISIMASPLAKDPAGVPRAGFTADKCMYMLEDVSGKPRVFFERCMRGDSVAGAILIHAYDARSGSGYALASIIYIDGDVSREPQALCTLWYDKGLFDAGVA